MTPSKVVTCPFCEFTSCKYCNERYLLQIDNDPKCMNCQRTWPREILNSILTKKFVTGSLKRHREEVLMDRERSLLPATQPAVEQEMRRREAFQRNEYLKREVIRLRTEMERVRHEMWRQHRVMMGANETLPEFRAFLHKCPNTSCRGFLSTAYKCSICKMYTCPDCNEIKGDSRDTPHECRPENILTMNMIRKDCKPCPGCAVQIYRVQGCDQMWCTNCQTPFSWRTGHVIHNGVIHNPHLYEWQQNNPARTNPNEHNECGLPSVGNVANLLNSRYSKENMAETQKLLMIHRFVSHTEHDELPRFVVNNEERNVDMRIKYLLNEISEENWKVELQRREKKNAKIRDTQLLLRAFVDASTDIIRLWMQDVGSYKIEPLATILSHLDKLRTYVNEQFMGISKRYTYSTTLFLKVAHITRQRPHNGTTTTVTTENWSWDRYKFGRTNDS